MDSIELKAYAKINLAIDLLRKRPDNYNEVKMIMQTIDIFDKVYIEKIRQGIVIECEAQNIPNDDRNIAYKAAKYVVDAHSVKVRKADKGLGRGDAFSVFINRKL